MTRPVSLTRRRFLEGAAGVAAAGWSVARPAGAGQTLTALTPCDHADPSLLRPFEEAFGVRVDVTEYEGTDAAIDRVERSQPGDWDVFVVDGVDVPLAAAQGILAELDESDFPWDDIFPELRQPELVYAGGKLYGVPEKFGYTTIAYNAEAVDPAAMRRLSALWGDGHAGRIAILDDYIALIELVGLGLGLRPFEIDAGNLGRIRDKLAAMKRLSVLVGDAAAVRNALVTGVADIVAGGGESAVAALQAERPALDWALPDEGAIRWSQHIGVFAGSAKKGLATEFLKYLLSPEGQALLATADCYWAMPANTAAVLSPEHGKTLRWDAQPRFIASTYNYVVPDAELDQAMRAMWDEVMRG